MTKPKRKHMLELKPKHRVPTWHEVDTEIYMWNMGYKKCLEEVEMLIGKMATEYGLDIPSRLLLDELKEMEKK